MRKEFPAIEDLVGAGAIIKRLQGHRSPEARVAVAAFESLGESLGRQLPLCSSGRQLVERGFAADVELAADLDVSKVVPILTGEHSLHPWRLVLSHNPPLHWTATVERPLLYV